MSAAMTFTALGDPSRCLVIERLAERPHSAGELARLADLTASSMSRHLRILLEAGLVADERAPGDARVRLFRLRPEAIADTAEWLAGLQRHWQANLDSFAAHVQTRVEGDGR